MIKYIKVWILMSKIDETHYWHSYIKPTLYKLEHQHNWCLSGKGERKFICDWNFVGWLSTSDHTLVKPRVKCANSQRSHLFLT